jgi:exodeoxyribonuclease VII small subunit
MEDKKLSFEDALDKIENIVETLENEQVTLEKSIALYKEGLLLSAVCQEKLALAEGEILQLQKNVQGQIEELPFAPSEEE